MIRFLTQLVMTKTAPEFARNLCARYLDAYTTFQWHKHVTHVPVEDPVEVMGIRFPNRIGIAAGFDRNGEMVSALGALGVGHVEIGTVTPVAQPGNPLPRVARLSATEAVVNRMGNASDGCEHVLRNLKSADAFKLRGGILGVNIGKNATTPIESAAGDFRCALAKLYDRADYFTVNISSPNTKRLGELQKSRELLTLLTELDDERTRLQEDKGLPYKPVAVKLSADLDTDDLYRALESIVKAKMDAVIVSNTSAELGRQIQGGRPFAEGGISGAPLMARSTKLVRDCVQYLQGRLPVIASGGVMSPEDAVTKIEAGADLVQIHTGLFYRGLGLPADCVDAVAKLRKSSR
ncbi:MAG: quinone-dependent dihydroorotate dehydrogenase [Sutterellaceae bacterium]|nr:quinone-dependent dihydroorotate dehydrogenase [Sutterellaceae bacterium]